MGFVGPIGNSRGSLKNIYKLNINNFSTRSQIFDSNDFVKFYAKIRKANYLKVIYWRN